MNTAFLSAVFLTLFVVATVGATILMFITFSWVEHLIKGAYSTTRAWTYALVVLSLSLTGTTAFWAGMSQGKRAQLTKQQIIDIARANFIETLDEKNKGQ